MLLQGSNPDMEQNNSLGSHRLWFSPQNTSAPHLPAVLSQTELPEEANICKYLCPRTVQLRARPPTPSKSACLTTILSVSSQVRTKFPR